MADLRDPWEPDSFGRPSEDNVRGPTQDFGSQPSSERKWDIPPNFRRFPARRPISPEVALKRSLRQNSNVVCGGLILVFLIGPIIIWVLTVMRWVIPGFDDVILGLSPVPLASINISIATLSLFLPAIIIARLLDMPFRAAFPMRRAKARMIVPGVFCCLGTSVAGLYIAALLTTLFASTIGATPTAPDFSPPIYGLAETIMFMIGISVIPAVFEELLFRGVIMQSLRRFGDGFALVTSSLLFAMLHRNFLQGPNALIVGMVLGYFTLRTGSLIPAIVAHFINNFMLAGITVAAMYMPARYAAMLQFSILPAYLALGAIGVILMIALNGGFTRLQHTFGEYELSARKKYLTFLFTPLGVVFTIVTLVLTIRHFEWI
ncbi:MAG: CPBP family intramembrane metalloprotease [Oscillospiraceae bacterium]|nr:CPBP family intramembrane metalloprotease [Oscillospiraceae bacterium]